MMKPERQDWKRAATPLPHSKLLMSESVQPGSYVYGAAYDVEEMLKYNTPLKEGNS